MKVYRKNHPDSTKRREAVIERLNAQLKGGKKTYGNYISGGTTDLTEADKVRINKELVTLKLRV